MARYSDPVCRLCRREGMKLFLEGRSLFQGQVRDRAPQLRARPAWPPPFQGPRLRHPASREAEGQAHLRPAGKAVPSLLPARREQDRHHRRQPAPPARAAARQRRLLARLRRVARPGAPARPPRPHRSERQEDQHPLLPGAARAMSSRFARRAARTTRSARPSKRPADAAFRRGSSSIPISSSDGAWIFRSAKTSAFRSRNSSSSNSTRSN